MHRISAMDSEGIVSSWYRLLLHNVIGSSDSTWRWGTRSRGCRDPACSLVVPPIPQMVEPAWLERLNDSKKDVIRSLITDDMIVVSGLWQTNAADCETGLSMLESRSTNYISRHWESKSIALIVAYAVFSGSQSCNDLGKKGLSSKGNIPSTPKRTCTGHNVGPMSETGRRSRDLVPHTPLASTFFFLPRWP